MEGRSAASAYSGTLHHYSEKLCAFEYGNPTTEPKPHSLLFISGLSDGLGTVPYINDIAKALEPTSWSIFAVLLSSSFTGWGTVDLDTDVKEIGTCVDYVRALKGEKCQDMLQMIVLMGHSTGSQDVLHYLYTQPSGNSKRPPVDGAILQAPVSDREGLLNLLTTGDGSTTAEEITKLFNDLVKTARANIASQSNAPLPLASTSKLGFPDDVYISSRRFLSLASPDSPESPLEDDLFSSDLSDQRLEETFGAIGSNGILKGSILVLPSGADEYVPASVDKAKLLARWQRAAERGAGDHEIWDINSGIVSGAKHSPSGYGQELPRKDLVARVEGYLRNIEHVRRREGA